MPPKNVNTLDEAQPGLSWELSATDWGLLLGPAARGPAAGTGVDAALSTSAMKCAPCHVHEKMMPWNLDFDLQGRKGDGGRGSAATAGRCPAWQVRSDPASNPETSYPNPRYGASIELLEVADQRPYLEV